MDMLQHLVSGFAAALTPAYLAYAFVGCTLGTLIGVLPGLGPAAGTAILIPLTFKLDPTGAIIMLSAIYYGAMYGGTITSVLINVPGEAASVITCIDGHQMAKQGRAGTALGIAAIGSFIGGTAATIALVLVAPPLASLALRFGPPEFFALMLFGLCLVSGLAGRSMLAALLMTVLGLELAMIGIDPVRGAPRFAFDIPDLYDGIGFIAVVMGLFGDSEILLAAEAPVGEVVRARLESLLPSREEWRRSVGAIWRGTGIGFALGLIPGIGAIVPTFMAYIVEKRVSKTPERFGKGAINGITPGPFLFQERPDLVWTVIASFFTGNVILLGLNLPLVGLWAKLLHLPFAYLCAGVLLFCVVGAYSLQQSIFDVWVMIAFGIVGYVFRKLDLPLAPSVLGMILA